MVVALPEPRFADAAGRRLLSDTQLIDYFLPRIRRMSLRYVCGHLPGLERSDLEANAVVAMLRAAKRHRGKVPFGAYIQRRLVGSMQDTLRREGRQAKRSRGGREEETAQGSVDTLPAIAPSVPAGEQTLLAKVLVSAIAATLSRREARAVRLIYVERLTLAAAGARLGIGESRMCQIHTVILGTLRTHLRLQGMTSAAQMV